MKIFRAWISLLFVFACVLKFDAAIGTVIGEDLTDAEMNELHALVAAGESEKISDEKAKAFVEVLRRKYPYISIRDRIQYETTRKDRLEWGSLREDALAELEQRETEHLKLSLFEQRRRYAESTRGYSLKLLHDDNVREFISREGNGFARSAPPGPSLLPLQDSYVKFDSRPNWKANEYGARKELLDTQQDDRFSSYYSNLNDNEQLGDVVQEYHRELLKANPTMMLTKTFLKQTHLKSVESFTGPWRMGHFESLDRVAGFGGHSISNRVPADPWDHRLYTFKVPGEFNAGAYTKEGREAYRQEMNQAPPDAFWLMTSLQLVSLLKYETPMAYVSTYLPNMNELRHAQVRPLNDFEEGSLEELLSGEQIVIHAYENHIQMLGAIRASKECLSCHTAERGELLGAFSYELFRNKLNVEGNQQSAR